MAGSNALVLKFGTDFGDTASKLGELAGNVTRNMALVSAAAVATSRTLREQMVSGAADATKSLVSYAATWENVSRVATVASEAMKVGFALHHPVMAVGMQLLGNYKYALGAVAAGVLTAVEAFKFMADQVERANTVIANAEKAGVSTTFFQVWTEQAVKARLSVEEMERALQHASTVLKPTYSITGEEDINKMLRYSDQLQNGRRFGTESYQAFLGAKGDMDALQTAGALLVTDFQRAAVELGDASLKAQAGQIATQLWGEAGTKIAAALADGKIKAEEAAKAAQDNARIYSEDLLNATRDVNQQLAEAKKHLSDEMNPAMGGLVMLSNDLNRLWTGLVEKAAQFVGALARAGDLSTGAALEQAAGGLSRPTSSTGQFGDLEAALRRKYVPGEASLARFPPYAPHDANVPQPPGRPSLTELEKVSHVPKEAAGSSASAAKAAIDTYIESLEKANAVAKAELDTYGKSNIEKAKAVDLARAEEAAKKDGTTLTEAQRAQVIALAEAEGKLKDSLAATTKAQADMNAAQHAFADAGESAVEGLIIQHKQLADVLRDVVKQFEQMALKAVLTGGGPLAGLFGTSGKDGGVGGLFGGLFGAAGKASSSEGGSNFLANLVGFNPLGFDKGGVVGRDGSPMGFVPSSFFAGARHYADGGAVGIIAHHGEIVLNQAQQKNVASGMGGKVSVHNYAAGIDVTPQVTPAGVELIVRSRLAENNARMPGMLRDKQERSF